VRKKHQDPGEKLWQSAPMRRVDGTKTTVEDLIPLLLKVQNSLDDKLNLDALAAEGGYSRYHFHRLFTDVVGETPRAYVERLRLEKAAYRLWITNESVLDIALSVGFRSHEAFCRAFRRHFSTSPTELREGHPLPEHRRVPTRHWSRDDSFLSPVRFSSLRGMTLLAMRHIGGYETIPEPFSEDDHLWRKLAAWASERGIRYYPAAVCIYYDNPWLTPVELQHSDVCLPIATEVRGGRTIRCITLETGKYGVIEHTGPRSTQWQAFRKLADTIHLSNEYAFPDEPSGAVSIKRLNTSLDHLEVLLKVVRKN
jgi:AraC family transcriptional regulator